MYAIRLQDNGCITKINRNYLFVAKDESTDYLHILTYSDYLFD